jgi:hypothetical protein
MVGVGLAPTPGCGLRVTGYGLWVAGCGLRVAVVAGVTVVAGITVVAVVANVGN